MIAVPAVDLRGGRCVQLVGGRPQEERVSLPDPAAVARDWWETGFRHLHVVDLDAALGEGDNRTTVAGILESTRAQVQVGGGIRDDAAADALLGLGAARIVVGTRAVEDPDWLAALADRHPRKVVVAADVRDGEVLRRGWTEGSGLGVGELLASLAALPLAGVLWTDVGREGKVAGIDRAAVERVVDASAHPLWVAGGVSGMDDLRSLKAVGAAGAVLGMALYTGALDPREVARSFGGADDGTPARDADDGPHHRPRGR